MNLKQTVSAVAIAGATVMGSIALATSAGAAEPTPQVANSVQANSVQANAQHWVYYNRYAGVWSCELAGAGVYHRNLPGYGYVTNFSCYAAGTGYDLEVLV